MTTLESLRNPLKFHIHQKPSKITQIEPQVAKGCHFGSFWITLGIPFSINFPDRLNLLICNKSYAKMSFLPFQASHFGITNQSIFLFPIRFLDLFFLICFQFVQTVVDLGTPLPNPTGSKMTPKICQVAPNLRKSRSEAPWASFFMILKDLVSFQVPF